MTSKKKERTEHCPEAVEDTCRLATASSLQHEAAHVAKAAETSKILGQPGSYNFAACGSSPEPQRKQFKTNALHPAGSH